jgi:hypothetical protein
MKRLLIMLGLACLLATNLPIVRAEFDFCSGSSSDGGYGTFQQQILHDAIVIVGEIPRNIEGLSIQLQSDKDVDVQLYDGEDGTPIVKWAYYSNEAGILNGCCQDSTNYQGMAIEWSGYNGDGTGLGNEYINITGQTTRQLVMKAYGYQAGFATVDYSWSGGSDCQIPDTGGGSFQQPIVKDAIVEVGDIPPGVNNLYIRLNSDKDVDIQLYDKDDGTAIVKWAYYSNEAGILNDCCKDSTNYQGMTIEWSGYNGDGTGLGNEYIKITGETTRNLTMKAYGYQAGYAMVDYSWGSENLHGSAPKPIASNPGIIATYYDSSSRTVYAATNISNPRVYFAGEYITGGCVAANKYVKMMGIKPAESVSTIVTGALKANAKAKGHVIEFETEAETNASQTVQYATSEVYYFNFTSMTIKHLHYNVVGEKDGYLYSTGWLPDAGGGCEYVPSALQ